MKKNKQKTTPQKRKEVRAGEIWVINDIRTRGHKSRITRSKDEVVEHIPITHSPETRRIKNIPLKSNPNPKDDKQAYILPKVQVSEKKYLGRKHPEYVIKNPIDKSVVRHITKKKRK